MLTEAKERGIPATVVIDEHRATYHKDISKIAIGTARWADMVHEALAEAVDFEDFKARIGAKTEA